jgi:hypothetical protein
MAASKRAKRIRQASEFDLVRLSRPPVTPRRTAGLGGWDADSILSAREAQQRGDYRRPAQLVAALQTDPAIYSARKNRLAPTGGLGVSVVAGSDTVRGRAIRDEAEALFGVRGVGIAQTTIESLHGALADHGEAVGVLVWTPRPDGSRIDVQLVAWPMDYVRHELHSGRLLAFRDDGSTEEVVHGDGRWVVIRSAEIRPYEYGAIVPLARVFEQRAYGSRDRGLAAGSIGTPKIAGTLPEGVPIGSPEGQAFYSAVENMHGMLPYMVGPYGSKVEMLGGGSAQHQIFADILASGASEASRVYLGSDEPGATEGGSNYIRSQRLFGVRNDVVENDLRALELGILSGVILPWTAVNFGDSSLAPTRRWEMPDPDQDARLDSLGRRRQAFYADLQSAERAGVVVDQAFVDDLAREYGISAPRLKQSAPDSSAQAVAAAPEGASGPGDAPAGRLMSLSPERRARRTP